MGSNVISVENVSKQYRLGNVGLGSLSHDINRWWYSVRGKEDPYLKIGEENDRARKGISEYVWALKDINFEVRQGEVLGIIGRNGAGKSTLLKILSRTTSPTAGQIKIKGRVASLLEVGTGFHPELSGRENIFLNGAILGMTKQEIKSKFDEIVDFSGVERYIDTPVKRYSSGMYVRLAFAVAAYLEPEILIVDEVLAVGDSEFQKKALGKMKDVSNKEGRTVLFVSHNMAAVKNLCNSGLLLNNGKSVSFGSIGFVINDYQLMNTDKIVDFSNFERRGNGSCRITDIQMMDERDTNKNIFQLGGRIKVMIKLKKMSSGNLENIRIVIGVYNLGNEGYLRFDSKVTNTSFNIYDDYVAIICNIDEHLNIKPDLYFINVALFENENLSDYIDSALKFTVENHDYYGTGKDLENPELSKLFYRHSWEIKSLN